MKFDPSMAQTCFDSPLGAITLGATRHGLAGLWFDGQRHLPMALQNPQRTGRAAWPHDPAHPVLQQAITQLTAYFRGERCHFDLPLDLSGGTAFQQSVWQALLAIAPGQTCSYGALSAQIGQPRAVRAVGAAIGRNPISIVVPCHRVLGAGGKLTGYAGGLARKSALLHLEGGGAPAMEHRP